MITFGAKYISSANIAREQSLHKVNIPSECAFVELNPKSKADNIALATATVLWGGHLSLAQKIYDNFNITKENKQLCEKNTNFYALTTQKGHY